LEGAPNKNCFFLFKSNFIRSSNDTAFFLSTFKFFSSFEECETLNFSYEGLPLLIAAMPKILAKQKNVKLLLVGGGPDE
ncbi:MAG: glycosyltransferase family 4 protein, partial [Thiohalomonas sp.]|nr:glycosyltransferase family 4 protein [Thiohalomonas sp.]